MKKFIDAIIKSLWVLFIQVFLMPIKAVNSSINSILSSTESAEKSEFVILLWIKNIFEAKIVLAWPIGVVTLIYLLLTQGLVFSLLSVLAWSYFSPVIIGLIKELLSLTIINVLKLEEISRNTNKD